MRYGKAGLEYKKSEPTSIKLQVQFGCGISLMVGKKARFFPKNQHAVKSRKFGNCQNMNFGF